MLPKKSFGTKINRTLLYQEVVSALYSMIDEYNMQPGDKLPSEKELFELLKVSRNVLREAFHVLERRGIVISYQGKGRFLRSVPQNYDIDNSNQCMSKNLERYSLSEAYEVRQTLEVKGMELIIRNASDKDLQEIEKAYQEMLKKFEKTHTTIGEFTLHRLYAQKTGNTFMEHLMDVVLSTILEMMYTTARDVLDMHKAESEKKQHREIIDALKNRNVKAAQKAMFDHLQDTIKYLK